MEVKESYQLVIVDDDPQIREGLAEIVDWKAIGFRVAAVLEDGRDVIRFLEQQRADVVLSDIRMTFVSGLSLAKHLHTHYPDIRMVLISAYQEFELAKEALRYQVYDYLLKPTDLDEVYRVFQTLKARLDADREKSEGKESGKALWVQMIHYFREWYFPHLLFRTTAGRHELQEQMARTGLRLNPATAPCIPLQIKLARVGELPEEAERQSLNRNQALLRGVRDVASQLWLLPLDAENGSGEYVAVFLENPSAQLKQEIINYMEQLKARWQALFGLELRWEAGPQYASLYAFVQDFRQLRLNPKPDGIHAAEKWERVRKKWLEAIRQGSYEDTIHMMKQVEDRTSEWYLPFDKEKWMELLSRVEAVYEDERLGMLLLQLYRCEDPEEFKDGALELLRKIEQMGLGKNRAKHGNTERQVIIRAKQFMKQHLQRDLTLYEVADQAYLNPVYFGRLFKKETGESFSDYLTGLRMNQACHLLQNSVIKIYEIAEQVGYKDVRHFYKLFKKQTGMTPSEYRDQPGLRKEKEMGKFNRG